MSPLVNGLMEERNIRKSLEDVDVVNRWDTQTQLYIKDEHPKIKIRTGSISTL